MGRKSAQKRNRITAHLWDYLSESSTKVVRGMPRASKWRLQMSAKIYRKTAD